MLGVGFVEGGVELAVVGHDRIDEDEGVLTAKIGEDLFHDLDLFVAAEVAGVDGVKMDAFLFPVLGDRHELVGEILDGEILEHGVGGQHGRWQDGGLDAHGRDDWQGDGDGAFAEAGDVLDGEYAFHWREASFVFR